MPSLYLDLVGALVRGLLQVLLGGLIAHHYLTVDQAGQLVSSLVVPIVGVLGVVATLVWSWWKTWSQKRLQLVAQTMPAGSTEAAVKRQIASGAPVPSVLTSPTSIPIPLSSLL